MGGSELQLPSSSQQSFLIHLDDHDQEASETEDDPEVLDELTQPVKEDGDAEMAAASPWRPGPSLLSSNAPERNMNSPQKRRLAETRYQQQEHNENSPNSSPESSPTHASRKVVDRTDLAPPKLSFSDLPQRAAEGRDEACASPPKRPRFGTTNEEREPTSDHLASAASVPPQISAGGRVELGRSRSDPLPSSSLPTSNPPAQKVSSARTPPKPPQQESRPSPHSRRSLKFGGATREQQQQQQQQQQQHQQQQQQDDFSGGVINYGFSQAKLLEGVTRTDTVLGRGQFGDVYRGFHNGTVVALKRTRSPSNSSSPTASGDVNDFSSEFIKEAMVISSLSSDWVLRTFGICVSLPEGPWLVTEFCHYGNLKNHLLSHAPIPEAQLVTWFLQLAYGVNYLHSIHDPPVVHRDVAARNLLLDINLRVKLSDFGLSRLVDTSRDGYPIVNSNRLPLRWTAPEVPVRNLATREGDVYSMGVTAWELFNGGKEPFGEFSNNAEVREYVSNGNRPKQGDTPDDVFKIIEKCWAHEPNERPTAGEVVEELELLSKTAQSSSPAAGQGQTNNGYLPDECPSS